MATPPKTGHPYLPRRVATACACLLLAAAAHSASASLTVLVGEPYGNFGTMMPNGHAAVYLDRVCADGPLKLRRCNPSEAPGVVVARYHALGKLDWMATPVLEFLYAADRPGGVLGTASRESVAEARERYREQYLRTVVPDGQRNDKALEEWKETAGAAFDRKIWGYQIETTREQDERVVAAMNARPNRHLYHLKKTNCADFAAEMVNLYFPGTVHNDRIADFGLMSPKQVARCVEAYGRRHPEAALRILEVPQIPGTLRRSRPVRGGAEALLKTKRYLATLLVIQPEVPVAVATLYLWHGRWTVGRGATTMSPDDFAGLKEPLLGAE